MNAAHNKGLGVILDVVYNHFSDKDGRDNWFSVVFVRRICGEIDFDTVACGGVCLDENVIPVKTNRGDSYVIGGASSQCEVTATR